MKAWVGANDAPNAGKSLGEVTLHKYGHMPPCSTLKVRVLAIDQNFAICSPPRGPGESLGTHDAAAPSVTLDIPSAKTPAARQPRMGSRSCFRQLRAQGYGHVSTSWLVELDVVRGDTCPRQLSCTRATCHTTPVTW